MSMDIYQQQLHTCTSDFHGMTGCESYKPPHIAASITQGWYGLAEAAA